MLAAVTRRIVVREKAPESLGHMKTLKHLQLLASLGLVLTAGCVHEHVTYVTQVPPQTAPPPAPVPEPQPPPAPAPVIRNSTELDGMLGPIALYPDPLIAQILPAATTPDQVAAADNYLRTGGDVLRVEYEPWEPSVKAITRYPDVLRMMAGNLPWTSDVGTAFVNQENDVMDSIQRLRAQARALGNLQTTPQQVVIVESRVIQIVPANPQIIYVPVYRPEVVFISRPPRIGLHIGFGPPLPIGPWMNHDVNWHDRNVIVWHEDHPRPHDWWYEPPSRHERTTVINNTTIVNNYTVYNPRNRPAVAPKGPAQPGREREGQTREAQVRPITSSTSNHVAVTAPPAARPLPSPKQIPERQIRRPNHPPVTNAATHSPRSTASGTNAQVAATPGIHRPTPAEVAPSTPLSIETHRDPVPAPHQRNNAAQVRPNANAHPANAASSADKAAETRAEKKGKGPAKGQAKKTTEQEASTTNRSAQPRQ
jgi:uncharacterized protein DUF3300